MKKTGIVFALFAILLMTCAGARAQRLGLKTSPVTEEPVTQATDLSKLNIDKILEQLQTTKVQPNSEETSPLQVVPEFLQLSPSQATELGQLMQTRQTTLVSLFQNAQALTQQLGVMLSSGGNPALIGTVVIQIHALQQQMAQAQQAFLTQFIATLSPEQLQRLHAVQIAVQLQPILPAFQPVFLF